MLVYTVLELARSRGRFATQAIKEFLKNGAITSIFNSNNSLDIFNELLNCATKSSKVLLLAFARDVNKLGLEAGELDRLLDITAKSTSEYAFRAYRLLFEKKIADNKGEVKEIESDTKFGTIYIFYLSETNTVPENRPILVHKVPVAITFNGCIFTGPDMELDFKTEFSQVTNLADKAARLTALTTTLDLADKEIARTGCIRERISTDETAAPLCYDNSGLDNVT